MHVLIIIKVADFENDTLLTLDIFVQNIHINKIQY